jgi:hypothetical protein
MRAHSISVRAPPFPKPGARFLPVLGIRGTQLLATVILITYPVPIFKKEVDDAGLRPFRLAGRVFLAIDSLHSASYLAVDKKVSGFRPLFWVFPSFY